MRAILIPIAATGLLVLAGCGNNATDATTENQAKVAEGQTEATADRMQDHADALNQAASNMTDEAAVATATEANTVDIQADKTRDLVGEAGDRIREGTKAK